MKLLRAPALAALLTAFLLVGCGQAAPDEPKAPAAPKAQTIEEPQPEAPQPVEIGDRPDWAINPVDIGKLAGEQQGEVWNVQIFRLGTATTTSDGIWEMPGTNEPVIPMGTVMAVYNVVFTNTSDNELILDEAATIAGVTLFHRGVEQFKASLLSYDPEIAEAFGVSEVPYNTEWLELAPKFDDRPGLLVAPGESFAVAVNTWATAGEIEVAAFVNVMNDNGKPSADESELITFNITQ